MAKPSNWHPSEAPLHATERQRFHRLREKIRPEKAVGENADPWQLTSDILDELDALKVRVHLQHHPEIETLKEHVKRLVWGPDLPESSHQTRAPEEPVCSVCIKKLGGRRSDALYCSPACRQKAYRVRRRT